MIPILTYHLFEKNGKLNKELLTKLTKKKFFVIIFVKIMKRIIIDGT